MLSTEHQRRAQRGVSLIELMVGLTVGLLVIAAAGAMYITTSRSGRDALNSARLNVEVRGAMEIMVDDIRRAGFSAAGTRDNPFSTPGVTDLTIFNNGTASASGNCIVFAYDANANGQPDEASEYFGFRVQDNAVWMRVGGTTGDTSPLSNCTKGSWERITDQRTVAIVPVDLLPFFSITYQCLSTLVDPAAPNVPIAVTGRCTDPGPMRTRLEGLGITSTGDMIETRNVSINVGGQLVADTAMRIELGQQVLVRNHRLAVYNP